MYLDFLLDGAPVRGVASGRKLNRENAEVLQKVSHFSARAVFGPDRGNRRIHPFFIADSA